MGWSVVVAASFSLLALWFPVFDKLAWLYCYPEVKHPEQITFFPTDAIEEEVLGVGTGVWSVDVKGAVFKEVGEHPVARTIVAGAVAAARAMGSDVDLIKQRLYNVLLDNERGKDVKVSLQGCGGKPCGAHSENPLEFEEYTSGGVSGPDGFFTGTLRIRGGLKPGQNVTFGATNGEREFLGSAQLVGRGGLGVISDIDDTVKVTNIGDKVATIRATFVEHLVPVAGLAKVYRRWNEEALEAAAARDGSGRHGEALRGDSCESSGEGGNGWGEGFLTFYYVSGSPWFLATELKSWLADKGKDGGHHPLGSFHLKRFRFEVLEPWGVDMSTLRITSSNFNMKMSHIGHILDRHKEKAFVLVGDSSEQDPEVYGTLARERGRQVACILIRETPGRPWSDLREVEAFQGVPPGTYAVFKSAEELEGVDMRQLVRMMETEAGGGRELSCGLKPSHV